MSGLLKRGLVFCIKSINLVEMLIFARVGFIKVKVGIIELVVLGPSQTSKVVFFTEIVFG